MLEREHRFIAMVVGMTPVLAERIESGQSVSPELLRELVDFMRTYADKCHHGKEEELLFPLLVKKGVPIHGCPIGALSAEHVKGRALVKGLAEAIDAFEKTATSAKEEMVKNLRGIAGLYPGHIWKEDYLLFPMTLKVLNADELGSLYQQFEKVDEKIGVNHYQRLEQFAQQIERHLS
ncbi:hemerythrin domain-containing protein [candidate division KSB1 bacterium]|nr:hemerythrin domain-containing protein [candidate division KSB1 bacterium]